MHHISLFTSMITTVYNHVDVVTVIVRHTGGLKVIFQSVWMHTVYESGAFLVKYGKHRQLAYKINKKLHIASLWTYKAGM